MSIDDPATHLKRELGETGRLREGAVRTLVERCDYNGLLESVTPLIWSLALHKVNRRGWTLDPMDLMQEGCVAVLRALPQYDPDRAKLTTYCYLCADKAMLRTLREEVRRREYEVRPDILPEYADVDYWLEGLTLVSDEVDLEEDLQDAEQAYVLQRALGELPARQRQALELRMEGHGVQEIARKMSVSHQAVSNLLQRGVAKLTSACK